MRDGQEATPATVVQDDTVARKALLAGLGVLQRSGMKCPEGAAVEWARVEFAEFMTLMDEARAVIERTLHEQYGKRELEPGVDMIQSVAAADWLLMTAVHAWLTGHGALEVHPYSSTGYTWLALSQWYTARQLQSELDCQGREANRRAGLPAD
jgi:hypothetical protein